MENFAKLSEIKLGWIGIGVMGRAMASRVLSAGYNLTVKARFLESQGASVVDSPADVAKVSDVVFTMVGHPSDVESLLLGSNGVLSNLGQNCVVVDHTSSYPELARKIAAEARSKGCWAVNAPVSGGDVGARGGKLAIFAAGDCNVVAWLTPLFEVMGWPTYVGGVRVWAELQDRESDNRANLVGLSEGLVFAGQAGIDLRRFMEAVKGGAAETMVMKLFGQRMVDRDFKAGGFAKYMVKEENERAVVLPGAALSKQLFVSMVANGDAKMGIQGLATVIERMNCISNQ